MVSDRPRREPDDEEGNDHADAGLRDLPPDVSVPARFAYGLTRRAIPPDVHEKIVEDAERSPPMPWADS